MVELAGTQHMQAKGTSASYFSGLLSAVRVLPTVLERQQCPLRFEGGVIRRKLVLLSRVFQCLNKIARVYVFRSNKQPWFSRKVMEMLKRRSLGCFILHVHLPHLQIYRCILKSYELMSASKTLVFIQRIPTYSSASWQSYCRLWFIFISFCMI